MFKGNKFGIHTCKELKAAVEAKEEDGFCCPGDDSAGMEYSRDLTFVSHSSQC